MNGLWWNDLDRAEKLVVIVHPQPDGEPALAMSHASMATFAV